jgi:ribosomal protein L2
MNADIKVGNSKLLKIFQLVLWFTMLNFTQKLAVKWLVLQAHMLSLMAKEGKEALLRMPSGELRKVKKLSCNDWPSWKS